MHAHLAGGQHERLVLDGTCPNENLPVGRAGRCRERRRQGEDVGPSGRQCTKELREPQVVTDRKTQAMVLNVDCDDILTGERMSLLRRWVYGMEEAPADFLCRDCIYALTR